MEENEDDKIVNMIINYFSARVNIVEQPTEFSFGSELYRVRETKGENVGRRSFNSHYDPVSLSVAVSSISAVKFPFVSPRASASAFMFPRNVQCTLGSISGFSTERAAGQIRCRGGSRKKVVRPESGARRSLSRCEIVRRSSEAPSVTFRDARTID